MKRESVKIGIKYLWVFLYYGSLTKLMIDNVYYPDFTLWISWNLFTWYLYNKSYWKCRYINSINGFQRAEFYFLEISLKSPGSRVDRDFESFCTKKNRVLFFYFYSRWSLICLRSSNRGQKHTKIQSPRSNVHWERKQSLHRGSVKIIRVIHFLFYWWIYDDTFLMDLVPFLYTLC